MEARAGHSILDFETLFSQADVQELLNGSGLNQVISWNGRNSFHRIFPSNSQDFTTPQISFEFSGFYYTSKSFLIKPNNTNDRKTCPFKKLALLKNLPFSRNLVIADRKRRGQGGVMWTMDHKRSDANHIAWINLIQSNTTNCAKLGLMRVQKSYIVASSVQVTAPGLFGAFYFCGLKKLKGMDS